MGFQWLQVGQHWHGLISKFAIMVGVPAGLATAACLAAVPTATCYALADAYTIAVQGFGMTAFAAFFSYYGCALAEVFVHPRAGKVLRFGYGLGTAFCGLVIFLAMFVGLGTVTNGIDNLRDSVEHCFPTDGNRDRVSFDRLPLRRNPFRANKELPRP